MLASSPQQSRMNIRYYIWHDGNLLRLPNKLHHQLVDRERSIVQLADRRVKGIEAFISFLTTTVFRLTARGIIFNFDADGFLNSRPLIEAALEGHGVPPRFNDNDVVDLQPALRKKRLLSTYSWNIPSELLHKIKIDVMPGGKKITSLKPQRFN